MKNSNNDVVYIYKDVDGSEELKYSIRSVSQNWPHRKIWIIGDRPEWANDKVNVITPSKKYSFSRYQDVNNKLLVACRSPKISQKFWFLNDDFFILDEIDEEKFKTYYDGTLKEKHKVLQEKYVMLDSWPYLRGFEFAQKALKINMAKAFNNYETHVPILFDKTDLEKVLTVFPKAVCRRSIYMNLYHPFEGERHEDVKKYSKVDKVKLIDDIVSTDINSFNGNVGDYIKMTFKEKSIYER